MDEIKQKVNIEEYKHRVMYTRFIAEKTPSVSVTGKFFALLQAEIKNLKV